MRRKRQGRIFSLVTGGVVGLGLLGLVSLLDVQARSNELPSPPSSSDLVLIEPAEGEPKAGSSMPPASQFGNLAESDEAAVADTVDEAVLTAVKATWPEDSKRAMQIVLCESWAGLHPKAWSTSHPDGGPMQINKATWAKYFFEKYGWTWEQIVYDLDINLAAAREIYDSTGGWQRWACSDAVL